MKIEKQNVKKEEVVECVEKMHTHTKIKINKYHTETRERERKCVVRTYVCIYKSGVPQKIRAAKRATRYTIISNNNKVDR